MRELAALNQFFWKYRFRFFIGMLLVIATNYLAVLAPQITGYVVGLVQAKLPGGKPVAGASNDLIIRAIAGISEANHLSFGWLIAFCSITILILAILRGVFMFFMRQTIIVMSRHIEYDQKNQVYEHYQALDNEFYKTHSTGDLMSRITEDVSRVRMYTGPSLMYLINLISLIGFCLYNMFSKDIRLSLYVLSPLPILAITIYLVNSIINKKSEEIQGQLSDLTTNAQESYSGIRVIKSFVQEKAMLGFFKINSELYRKNAVSLAKVEAFYTPTMALMIGLSTLLTIYLGGLQAIKDPSQIGTIVEFVIYINMLTFPVSAIGWTASMIQRAAASQKRLNEFLSIEPTIQNKGTQKIEKIKGDIQFKNVDFINTEFSKQLSTYKLQPITHNLIYFDGNHSKKATLEYFELLLSTATNDSVWIFDDIHWSSDMEEAWEVIKNHPLVTVTIDTFQWGIVFFRKEQKKEHFIINPNKTLSSFIFEKIRI